MIHLIKKGKDIRDSDTEDEISLKNQCNSEIIEWNNTEITSKPSYILTDLRKLQYVFFIVHGIWNFE